jgi:hypothetical protein
VGRFLRREKLKTVKKPEPPRDRIEAAFVVVEKGPRGERVFNNRPEPETMRLRMSRDEVTRVVPILVRRANGGEVTREYGYFDTPRAVWVAYRMSRQGGVVRYDIADLNTVTIETDKREIKTS